MKLLEIIQFRSAAHICGKCIHFQNDPALIEEAFPGLIIMSSGFASVRDKDGLCEHKDLYLSARDSCADFTTCADIS